MNRLGYAAATIAMWSVVFGFVSAAAQAKPFYEGKTLRLIISSAPGGGVDLRGRLFSRHVVKHLPGNPEVIAQNMPGAGGMRARNYLYNIAKADGLTIAEIIRGTALQEAIGEPAVRYKADKFNWLGNLTTGAPICPVRIDRGGKNLKEAIKRSATSQLRNAETYAGSTGAMIARLLKKFTGLNLKVVAGYKGAAAINLAIERGEADMRCGLVWSSAKASKRHWFKRLGSQNPLVSILVQTSPTRLPDLSDVPTLVELAPDASWKAVAEVVTSTYQNAYPILAPPGIRKELVKILRDAFWATVHDPEYLAEAKRTGFLDDVPFRGEKVQELIQNLLSIPEEPRRYLRTLTGK